MGLGNARYNECINQENVMYRLTLTDTSACLTQANGPIPESEQIAAQNAAILEFWTAQVAADFSMGRSTLPRESGLLVMKAASRVRRGEPHGLPVATPVAPITWESLALRNYGTTNLTRGEKAAITREYNRRMGIPPRKRAVKYSSEWFARAEQLYPGLAFEQMKPSQKAHVTRNIKKFPPASVTY